MDDPKWRLTKMFIKQKSIESGNKIIRNISISNAEMISVDYDRMALVIKMNSEKSEVLRFKTTKHAEIAMDKVFKAMKRRQPFNNFVDLSNIGKYDFIRDKLSRIFNFIGRKRE